MNSNLEMLLQGGAFKQLFKEQMKEILKKYNIKKIDLQILSFLKKSGESNTAKDIQKYLQMNKGHISTALDLLCKNGYIKVCVDDNDHRVTHYILLDKAENIIQDLDCVMNRIEEEILNGVTEEELQVLEVVSKKIGNNILNLIK